MCLIDILKGEDVFYQALRQTCSENGYCVDVCDDLKNGDDLNHDLVAIFKIDDILSSRNMHNPPKAVDCMFMVKKRDSTYKMVLVELRNVGSSKGVKKKDIISKFESTIDFLESSIRPLLSKHSMDVSIFSEIEFLVVTDPFGDVRKNQDFKKTANGTVVDSLRQVVREIFGKLVRIEVELPSPNICF